MGSGSTIPNATSRQRDQLAVATQRRQTQIATTLLRGVHQRAFTAQVEVDLGELEAVGGGNQRLDPRVAALHLLGDQPTRGCVRATAHSAAQLMQLGDAEPVGIDDDHHGCVGHVDADLDDGGGHEHVDVAATERIHHGLLLRRRHPTVQQRDAQALQLVVMQPFERLLCAGHLQLLALLDERAHHVRLPTGGDLVAHGGPRTLLHQRPVGPLRDDGRATRR